MPLPGVLRRVSKAFPSIIQAVALLALIHLVGQGVLTRFGSARYRFSKSYSSNFGSGKVQSVIKYIDKNIPTYHKKGRITTTKATTTTTTTTPGPPPALAELEAEQARRVSTLRDTCYNLESTIDEQSGATNLADFLLKLNLPTKPMWQNLYCSKEHKLSYCPLFKVATTFLLKKFLLISPSGKYNKQTVKNLEFQANVLARKEFGYLDSWDDYPTFTKEGTTMIFVRHPFERLLSAFRDKLEDPQVKGRKFNEYYYNKYGRKIVMHYRVEKITGPTYKYPRFGEFIEFLLNRDIRYDDEHWAPYFKDCSLCQIDYNFIGHFETLYWDMHLLANRTGLIKQWEDPGEYFQSSTYFDVSKEYFKLLDRDTIRQLYHRYRLDFDLFGYSPDEYIAVGRPGPDDVIVTTQPPTPAQSQDGGKGGEEGTEHQQDNADLSAGEAAADAVEVAEENAKDTGMEEQEQ